MTPAQEMRQKFTRRANMRKLFILWCWYAAAVVTITAGVTVWAELNG